MSFRELIRQHPFLRILLPLIIGISFANSFTIQAFIWEFFLLLGFLGILTIISIPSFRKSYSYGVFFGLFLSILLVGLSAFRMNTIDKAMHIQSCDSCQYYRVELLDTPSEKTKSFACVVRIKEAISLNNINQETAKGILYLQKDSNAFLLKPGDQLLINTKLNKVINAGNPYEFDYAGYLKTQHILYSSYLDSNSWLLIDGTTSKSLRLLALKWRSNLLNIYRDKGIVNESYDILAALTLGSKTNLDPELKRAWADAGAMHVLAVSGLHVGIIFLVMNYLLGFLTKMRGGNWLKGFLLLACLWMYALLTGMSPSVMRAACMFSFIIVGGILNRKGGIFNSLAASACFLLLFDPYLLFTVGFQFSYLAVAGIVFFQPRFDKMIYIENFILRKFWQLTTVAISAQIATFPLAIYYFNQFPTYFLLSGYVVILMAGLLIYLSALLLIFANVEWISNPLAWILQHSVEGVNWLIVKIQELPGAVIRDCTFSSYQVTLLYFLLFSLIFILFLKRKKAVFTLLIVLVLYQLPGLISKLNNVETELVVFNAGRNSLVGFCDDNRAILLLDGKLDEQKRERLTKSYFLHKEITNIEIDTIQDIDCREIGGKNIVFIGRRIGNITAVLDSLNADIVVCRKGALKSKDILTKQIGERLTVFDASVYKNDLDKLDNINANEIDNVHNVRESGALIYILSTKK